MIETRKLLILSGGAGRIRTADKGFADLCLSHLATAPYAIKTIG